MLKYCRGDNRTIHPEHTIAEKPEIIDTRAHIGDWEGDTVLGGNGKGGLVTMVERKSRYLLMALISDKRTATVERTMNEVFKGDVEVKSITLDTGAEFANFRSIEKTLKITIYFTDVHSPWQRGTNENTKGSYGSFFQREQTLEQ